MPVECHAHLALDGHDWKAALARHAQGPCVSDLRSRLQSYKDCGVTFVRDGGDRFGAGLAASRLAPDYDISFVCPGAPLYPAGRYGSFIGLPFSTLQQCFDLIDQNRAAGAGFVKLMASGILDFSHYGVISSAPLQAELLGPIVDYAHSWGMPVMVHVNGAAAIATAARAGADSIEHGYYMDEAALEALAQVGAIWVPTLSPLARVRGCGIGDDEVLARILDEQATTLAKAREMGIPLACGSDAGAGRVYHGSSALDERKLMEQALGEGAAQILSAGDALVQERFAASSAF